MGVGVNTWEFGTLNAGGVTYDNELRAGSAFGFDQPGTVLQALPVTTNSQVQVEVKYEITLDSAGFVTPSINVKSGIFNDVTMTFPTHTAAGTSTHVVTSNTSSAAVFQLTNNIGFAFLALVTGSYRIHYIKVTIDHA